MAYDAARYREHLKALLPPGQALPREAGTTLDALLDAMSQELARIDARGEQLIIEALPQSTTEMIEDWERVVGLPDNCSGLIAETIEQRRLDVVSKLVARGGQSRAYFIAVALALGFIVTIDEFRPFRVGINAVGDDLTNGDWIFTWRVFNTQPVTVTRFRTGLSTVGQRLATWGNSALECRLRKIKPAHTILIFGYYEAPYEAPAGWKHVEASLDTEGLGRIRIDGVTAATGSLTKGFVPGTGPGFLARYTVPDGGSLSANLENFRVTKAIRNEADFTPTPFDFGPDSDPKWDDVVVAMPFNGVDGSTVFTDLTGRAWTRAGGSGTEIDTSVSLDGGASGKMVPGSWVTTPHDSNIHLAPPWTIDFWIYQPEPSAGVVCQFGQVAAVNAGVSVEQTSDGGTAMVVYTNDYPAAPALSLIAPAP